MNPKENGNRRKASIAHEIMTEIGRVVFPVFAIIAVLAIVVLAAEIQSVNKNKLTLQSESAAWQLADFFDQYSRIVEQLAVNPEVRNVMNEAGAGSDITKTSQFPTVFHNMVNIEGTDSENILAVWIADIDANVVTQSDSFTSGSDWEITQRAWYSCIENKTTILTEPYVDPSTGGMILSAVAPVYDEGGSPLGAAGLDISLEHVSEVMSGYKIGTGGYEILFSNAGMVLYHPNSSLILKTAKEAEASDNVLNAIANNTADFMSYSIGGDARYGYSSPIGDTGYMVLSALSVVEFYSKIIMCLAVLAIVFTAATILIVFGIKKTARKITEPVTALNKAAQCLAEGDLDVKLHIDVNNEIGELGKSISQTVDRLKEYIVYIDEISVVLSQMADGKLNTKLKNDYVGEFQKLKDAMLNISSSFLHIMQEIHTSAGAVSIGADELAKASQMLAEGSCNQAAAVDSLVQSSMKISQQVDETGKEAENSVKGTNQLNIMMENNQQLMNQMMEAMEKIYNTSKQVVGIIHTIEEIADQTNLLSLNASIEAARAGEAGRGFAVVADEIGSLADESSKAANTTTELISASMKEIEKGNALAKDVLNSLADAVGAVGALKGQIKKTADNAVDQAVGMRNVQSSINNISQGISDSSAVAQESSATSEELAAQASTLNDLISKFEF